MTRGQPAAAPASAAFTARPDPKETMMPARRMTLTNHKVEIAMPPPINSQVTSVRSTTKA
jgi:hypothetical protein